MLETIGDVWLLGVIIFFIIIFSILLVLITIIAVNERGGDSVAPLFVFLLTAIVLILVGVLLAHLGIDLLTPLENYFKTPI